MEMYNNIFNLGTRSSGGRVFNNRGGSSLIYSNTVNVTGAITLMELHADMETTEYINIYGQQFTSWVTVDQVENSHFWANKVNGNVTNDYVLHDWDTQFDSTNVPVFLQQGRDYFLTAPSSSGQGAVTWSDMPGGHAATFTSGASAYYPYTPLVYPDPLVGSPTNSASTNTTVLTATWMSAQKITQP